MNLKERMAVSIKHSGKTQAEIARIMQISKQYLGNITSGKIAPENRLITLSEILSVPLQWLTHGEGSEPHWLREPKTEIIPNDQTTGKRYAPSEQRRRETTTTKTRKPSALSPSGLILAMADKFNTTMTTIAELLTKNNETNSKILESTQQTAAAISQITQIHQTHETRLKQIEEAIEKLSDDALKAARKKTEETKNDK